MLDLNFLYDVLKYTISGLLVVFAALYVIKPYLDDARSLKRKELQHAGDALILPLKLQAYERLVLFLERLEPSNMLLRLHVPGSSAAEMQQLILTEIRAEYQHNSSQQVYVSNQAWAVVKRMKDDTVNMVGTIMSSLPKEASSVDLSKAILHHVSSFGDDNPYDRALSIVKNDIQQLHS